SNGRRSTQRRGHGPWPPLTAGCVRSRVSAVRTAARGRCSCKLTLRRNTGTHLRRDEMKVTINDTKCAYPHNAPFLGVVRRTTSEGGSEYHEGRVVIYGSHRVTLLHDGTSWDRDFFDKIYTIEPLYKGAVVTIEQ